MSEQDALRHWQAAYEPLQEGVLIVELSTARIRLANPRAAQLLGTAAEQMVGQSIHDYAATLEDSCFWGSDAQTVGQGLHSCTLWRHAQGHEVPLERRIVPFSGLPTPSVLVTLLDRSELQASERTLETLLSELRATLDSAADGMLVSNLRGEIRAFNERFVRQWQVPQPLLLERNDAALWAWMRGRVSNFPAYEQMHRAIAQHPRESHTTLITLADGTHLEARSTPQWQGGRVTGRVTSFRDVTRELQEQANARLAARVFECSPDAVFVTDAQGRIVHTNPAFEQLTQFTPSQAQGMDVARLFSGPTWSQLQQSAADGEWLRQEVRLHLSPERECVAQLTWVVVRDNGVCTHSVGFLRDLTLQRAVHDRLQALAYRDSLTGLPNRLFLTQRQPMQAGERHALLSLDLDQFKRVNESLGEGRGDEVLHQVVERLGACLRPTDVLARIGGDEFAICLKGAGREGARKVASRVMQAMERPFQLGGVDFSLQCSIGAAVYPEDATNMEALILHADTAMYRMKERGRGQFGFYERSMDAHMLTHMQLDHALRQALGTRQIQVHYQPQISLGTGRIVGAEALVRWTDPQRGPISPGVFIPMAEETGFILQLGAWVLEQALTDASRCLRAGTPITVAVNVSALEFRQPEFVPRLAEALRRHSLPPHWLELELTESVLLERTDEVAERLRQTAALGVRLAVDDFGTGYSSLSYLKTLPIRKLKIDQSFIRGIPQDGGDCAIVRAVVHMGKALGLEVVAEGVEQEAQRAALSQLECDGFQGYLYAPALPFETLQQSLLADLPGSEDLAVTAALGVRD